jgi:hypothetical protein
LYNVLYKQHYKRFNSSCISNICLMYKMNVNIKRNFKVDLNCFVLFLYWNRWTVKHLNLSIICSLLMNVFSSVTIRNYKLWNMISYHFANIHFHIAPGSMHWDSLKCSCTSYKWMFHSWFVHGHHWLEENLLTNLCLRHLDTLLWSPFVHSIGK